MATVARRDAVLDSSVLIQHTRVREKRNSVFIRSLQFYNPCLSVLIVYELEFGHAAQAEPLISMICVPTSKYSR